MYLQEAVREYLYDIECRNYTQKTIKGYKNNLLRFAKYTVDELGIDDLEEVRPVHIKNYLNYLSGKKRKAIYINGILKNIRSFFKYCSNEGYCANVSLKVKWLHEEDYIIKTFEDEHIKEMLAYYKGNDFLSIRNRTIIAVLVDTGIRNSELCNLSIADVKESIIYVFGKGAKERIVPISAQLKKMLIKYERARTSYLKDDILKYNNYFLSYRNKPLTVEGIERIIKLAGENIKGIRISPHTIRHYYAQTQLRNGADVHTVSVLLGHNNMNITKTYLKSMEDKKIVEMGRKTSPLNNLIK